MYKKLFRDNQLLGGGYDRSLYDINNIIPLEVINIPSGTEFGTWVVPDEWIVRDAWVKFKGEKIIDYQKEPLSLMVYSEPFKGIITAEELKKHLHYSEVNPDTIPYTYSFYEKNWGFNVKRDLVLKKKPGVCELGDCHPELKAIDPEVGKVTIEGQDYSPKFESVIEDGEYEVFIDTEFRKGSIKIGVHTIKGKSDREVLLFAHLDHPYQANDNLSGVQCLIDVAKQIKADHTIKIIFCPETIGSIAYAETQDISKVDFVIAVDICGNDNTLLIQKAFDKFARINYVVHSVVQDMGISYRKGEFRLLIGSDEYFFNDPLIGIPGILLSRYPYKEYHTSADKPEIIKEEKIKETTNVVLKTIEVYEKDYIPVRKIRGILRRSKFGLQSPNGLVNRDLDYLWYDCDGKKYISELVLPLGITFDFAYSFFDKLKKENIIYDKGIIARKIRKHKASK